MYQLQKLTLHHNEFQGTVPKELCDLRDEGSLHFLWVDCSPMSSTNLPKVSCPIDNCCSICFEGYDDDGGPTTGTGLNPPTKIDTTHSVQDDTTSQLKNLLMTSSNDKGMALMDIDSPQFHSYGWMVQDSPHMNYSIDRMLQRYALGVLYFATNGVNWSMSDGWVTTEDECTWYGISGCKDAATESIVSIELKGNELVGTIPSELFEFIPGIKVLNLATNVLKGSIPTEIGMLSDINIIELAENELTGDIPGEIGNLNTIDHLFLQSNNFGDASMPDEVCELRTVGTLTLLWADCKSGDNDSQSSVSFVQCSPECCTTCFDALPPPLSPSSSSSEVGGGSGGNNVFEQGDTSTAVTHSDSGGSADDVLAMLKKMAPGELSRFSSIVQSTHFVSYPHEIFCITTSYVFRFTLIRRCTVTTVQGVQLANHVQI